MLFSHLSVPAGGSAWPTHWLQVVCMIWGVKFRLRLAVHNEIYCHMQIPIIRLEFFNLNPIITQLCVSPHYIGCLFGTTKNFTHIFLICLAHSTLSWFNPAKSVLPTLSMQWIHTNPHFATLDHSSVKSESILDTKTNKSNSSSSWSSYLSCSLGCMNGHGLWKAPTTTYPSPAVNTSNWSWPATRHDASRCSN